MIVLDNLVYNLQRAGGISTYWYELSSRLIRDEMDVRFIQSQKENHNIAQRSLNIDPGLLIPGKWPSNIINRFKPVKLSDFNDPFIFHSSYNRITSNKKAVHTVTVHDFIHEKFYNGPRRFLHSYQKTQAINKAAKIIAVSNNTKKDLIEFYPNVDPANIHVIYNGVGDDFFIINKAENTKPYLVYVGSREGYKNFNFTVQLMKELKDFELYIVGKPLIKDELKLLEDNIKGKYRFFSNADNSQLNNIYNNAFALLYPSSYEGFGIPLLEAMRTGLPFVALNKSSIPEVAGNAGELLDELDIDLFKYAINKIDQNREKYITEGLKRAAQFSWEKCYRETIEVYKKLI